MAYVQWAESQLAEIELLSSMFPSQDELDFSDPLAVALLRRFVEGSASSVEGPPTSRPQFQIKQKMQSAGSDTVDVIVSCAYPSEYPSVLPEITVRCGDLNRSQQSQLHSDLGVFLRESCLGEVCVLSAVDWLKDHLHLYAPAPTLSAPAQRQSPLTLPPDVFTRLWIYSHHIYNKTKRKNILEWSKELGLSGFSMPGKPGVVCVEGPQAACEDFWARVKVLTWKKIMIRHREDVPLGGRGEEDGGRAQTLDSLRKFSGFEEAMFDPHGNRGNHMDLGQLYHFLDERGLGDVFRMYFGIEGRYMYTGRSSEKPWGRTTSPTLFHSAGGELLTSTGDVDGRWKECFEHLLNPTVTSSDEKAEARDSHGDSPITQAEVTEVVGKPLHHVKVAIPGRE